jgi:signal transduction histidine kinase
MRLTWPRLGGVAESLSARLLVLTLFFVMVSEVVIYLPSIARFRLTYLEERIDAARLATLALEATPEGVISMELEGDLLRQAEIDAVVAKSPETRALILGAATPPTVQAFFDLRGATLPVLIRDAFQAMVSPGRTIRIIGDPMVSGDAASLDVILSEAPLRRAMFEFSGRILSLSLVIGLITGGLVFLSLNLLMVRPMRRITASMTAFREAPQEAQTIVPTSRRDEIGQAQRELAEMQSELRMALKHRERLAQLGGAVSKINHDLRNILATAQLVSDRLADSGDPEVRRLTPTLVSAIDRAVELCSQTLQFGRAEDPVPRRSLFRLHALVEDVGTALGLAADSDPLWRNEVAPDLQISADREQIFRVLMNIGRNAAEALRRQEGGRIFIDAALLSNCVTIDIADNGPGLPEIARKHLFKPFKGSARAGGTGLGLAIARDLIAGHGGEVILRKSDETGATFRIEFPSNIHEIEDRRQRKASM